MPVTQTMTRGELIASLPPERRADHAPAQSRQPQGPLSATERAMFKRCEESIQKHIDAWVIAGEALKIIRNQRLYRAEYRTFPEYMIARWSFGPSRARQLIRGRDTHLFLKDSVTDVPPPTNEAQCRELNKHKPKVQIRIWRMVNKRYERPTENAIREVAAEIVGEEETPATKRHRDFAQLRERAIHSVESLQSILVTVHRTIDRDTRLAILRVISDLRALIEF